MSRYIYNYNAFNTVETEEDAYWLGFILADGYVSNANLAKPYLQIKLTNRDRDHLVKFITYMGYQTEDIIKDCVGGAYTKDNPCNVVKISNRQISKNLEQYGLSGAKSGKEKPYKCNTIELEKAYIRGIIDGDGYIRTTQEGFGIVGSYETLSYIKDFIQENIADVSNNHIVEHGVIYKFALSSQEKTYKILHYFYNDAKIYLDRKYKLYLDKEKIK